MKPRLIHAALLTAGMMLLGTAASPARAHDKDWREIRRDRAELRQDYRELARDRADYRRAQARGDSAGMRRERMEIRHDWREIHRDRAELRRDVRDARHERYHDHAVWRVPLHVHWHAGGSWQNSAHHFGW